MPVIKKILMVGSDQVWSLERIYLKHLKQLGYEVEIFAIQDRFQDYYQASLINKIIFRAGLSGIYKKLNEELLFRISVFKPDLVFVFKGMELFPQTVKKIRESICKIVNYNPDNPFLFSGRGSGNSNVTRSIAEYSAHFTYDRKIRETMLEKVSVPCFMLPFGFELSETLYNSCIQQEEVLSCCFLGNPDKNRASFVEAIAERSPIHVYGHGWADFTSHKNVQVHSPVYGDDFWKTLYRYRVQLNIMRPHNPASHNMRSFEIAGVGGIGLYPDTIDHREYFSDKGIARLYRDAESCVEQVEQILALPVEQAIEIRKKARATSLQSGYDYYSRTKQFLEHLGGLS